MSDLLFCLFGTLRCSLSFFHWAMLWLKCRNRYFFFYPELSVTTIGPHTKGSLYCAEPGHSGRWDAKSRTVHLTAFPVQLSLSVILFFVFVLRLVSGYGHLVIVCSRQNMAFPFPRVDRAMSWQPSTETTCPSSSWCNGELTAPTRWHSWIRLWTSAARELAIYRPR